VKTFLYKILYSPELNPFFRFIAGLTSAKGKFPPSGRLKFRVNQTAFRLHTNQSNYLTKLAYWNGAAQFEYSSEFERLCKKCSMFMDIGANIGYFTVIAGKSNPQMKIAAFEPARGPLHYLKRNVALNELDSSVMVESMALSNKQGKITFNDVRNPKYRYLKYNLAGEGNIGVEVKNRDILQYEVDTVTLDAYVSLHGIKPDLIKIDTEGTEHIILKHGLETIRNARPIIISEILFHRIEKDLDDLFLPEGYVFFYHTEKGLVKTDRLERTSDNGVRNAFLVPEEKLPLIQEFLA
jgi:FkbM family methyltransferase